MEIKYNIFSKPGLFGHTENCMQTVGNMPK